MAPVSRSPIHALVRPPTTALARCALTHVDRRPIDAARAAAQHREYVRALEEAEARVVSLAAEPELPDAPFVEDTAVIVDGLPILARPADEPRRREVPSVAQALAGLAAGSTPIAQITAPGTLEGGDVLAVGTTLFVGISGRTNREGARQLGEILERIGHDRRHRVVEVPLTGCLHLKTAVTLVAPGLLLANPGWVDVGVFEQAFGGSSDGIEILFVDPKEPFAANTLTVGAALLASASHPRTLDLLERRGLAPRPVDISELEKAEAGLTCLSLVLRPGP